MDNRYSPYYPTVYKRENPAGSPPKPNPIPSPYVPRQKVGLSVGNWVGTMLLTMIPVVNVILMFYWAFSKKTKPSKKTWARANIVLVIIFIVLAGVAFGALTLLGINILNSLQSSLGA